MNQLPVYMDFAATTPCLPEVVEALLPYYTDFFGNEASTVHAYGWQASAAVHAATVTIAEKLHCIAEEIIFTSGATEACNLAIRGVVEAYHSKGKHIITTKVEHKAVLDTCKQLEKRGCQITYLDVDEKGLIDLNALEQCIQSDTILIAIQFANNETGVLQDIAEVGAIAKKHQVLFFTDATQAVGKLKIDVEQLQVDMLCLSAHKIYGPKGIGALYIRRRNPRVTLIPQITGGGQQKDRRSGTLNVPAIVGMAKAFQMVEEKLQDIENLQNQLEKELQTIEASFINGAQAPRVKGITNICFPGIINSQLLSNVKSDLAISAGSACSTDSLEPSFVLTAMGIEKNIAKSAIRISIGATTTQKDIEKAIAVILSSIKVLKQ